jgi:hypothetical protein
MANRQAATPSTTRTIPKILNPVSPILALNRYPNVPFADMCTETKANKQCIVRLVPDESLLEALDAFEEMSKFFERSTDTLCSLKMLNLAVEYIELLKGSVQHGLQIRRVEGKRLLARPASETKLLVGCDMPERLQHFLSAFWTRNLEALLKEEIAKHKNCPPAKITSGA